MTAEPSVVPTVAPDVQDSHTAIDGAYNPESVQIYKDAAHIRQRPGMYIGGVASSGLHHLVYELVYNSAGTLAGSLPISRNPLPSIRTRPVSRCGFPVQCTVSASDNLSPGDQMLKYGSHATSGTEGGRSGAACAMVAPMKITAARKRRFMRCMGKDMTIELADF